MAKKINECGGRIVKDENTTSDVNIHSIKQQAKKFGNDVNDDGFPKYNISQYFNYLKKDLKESWLQETEKRTDIIIDDPKFKNSEDNQLNELFDKNLDYKVEKEIGYAGLSKAINYKIDIDGAKYDMSFLPMGNNIIEFGFIDENGQDTITNNGNNFKVFNICVDIIKEYIEEYKPEILTFNASKNEPSRKKLYSAIVKKLKSFIESKNYEILINDNKESIFGDSTEYKFIKKNINEGLDDHKHIMKNNWDYPEELILWLFLNKFKKIGKGSFSTVFKQENSNIVIKVIGTGKWNQEDEMFDQWYDFCKQNKSKFLPKFGSIKNFNSDNKKYQIVFTENLSKMPGTKLFSIIAIGDIIKHFYTENNITEENFNKIVKHVKDKEDIPQIKEMIPLLQSISKNFNKSNLDIQLSNFMMRGNTIVINDIIGQKKKGW